MRAAAEAGHEVDGFGGAELGGDVRSPSFSRSSSSMRTIMRPDLSSSRASGMSMNPAARSVMVLGYPFTNPCEPRTLVGPPPPPHFCKVFK